MQLEQENETARSIGLQNLEAIAAEFCNIENDRASLTTRNLEITSVYQQ
jgi:hypothetical protein